MAILHYKVIRQEDSIKLNRYIHSQQFTLKKLIVVLCKEETGALKIPNPVSTAFPNYLENTTCPNQGLLDIQPSYLSGLEIISGDLTSSNSILVSLQMNKISTDTGLIDWNFDSEDVPEAFQVKTLRPNGDKAIFFEDIKDDKNADGTPKIIDLAGVIKSIDMFFEFQSLSRFDGF